MRLWSIQHPDVYQCVVLDKSVHRQDWKWIDDSFLRTYRWMIAQMRQRGIGDGQTPPVWAWYKWGPPKFSRPDLRSRSFASAGTPLVMMKLDVPDNLVLLSCYTKWHIPLNHGYLSENEADDEAFEKRGAPEAEVEASWHRVFDIQFGDPKWIGRRETREVQACIPELRPEWVKSSTFFIAR